MRGGSFAIWSEALTEVRSLLSHGNWEIGVLSFLIGYIGKTVLRSLREACLARGLAFKKDLYIFLRDGENLQLKGF